MSQWKLRRIILRVCASLVVFLAGSVSFGQLGASGDLTGTIGSENGERLPGVTVTVQGQGRELTQISDQRGRFRFGGLEPGEYSLTLALEGFGGLQMEKVRVGIDQETALQLVLPTAIEESISVTAEAPLVDKSRVVTGTKLTRVEIDAIPTGEDPYALLRQVAGVNVDRVDVAGSESANLPQFRAAASLSNQNDFQLDGVPVNTHWTGNSSIYYAGLNGFTEMQYTTGGTDVGQRTGGVAINMVTRRGTNRARGSLSLLAVNDDGYLGGLLPQSSAEVDAEDLGPGQEAFTGSRIRGIDSGGIELGGPVVRDRFWLWGSFQRSSIGTTGANDYPMDVDLDSYSARVDVQIAKNNSARFSFNGSSRIEEGTGASFTRPPETTLDQDRDVDLFRLSDTHIFSKNLLVTFVLGYGEGGPVWAARGGQGPDAAEVWTDDAGILRGGYHSGRAYGEGSTVHIDGSWYSSGDKVESDLRFGARFRDEQDEGDFRYPGRNLTTDAPFVTAYRGNSTPPTDIEINSFWAQDTLRWGRLAINLGLRYDRQRGKNLAGIVPANPAFPAVLPAIDFPGSGHEFTYEDLVPRVGVTWDARGNGKTLLRASASRFADQLLRGTVEHTNPLGLSGAAFFFSGGRQYQNEPVVLVFPFGYDPANPGAAVSPNRIDPDLSAPVTDEVILGFDQVLGENLLLTLNVLGRRAGNEIESRTLVRDASGEVRELRAEDYVLSGSVSGTVPGTSYSYDEPIYALPENLDFTGGNVLLNGDREREYLGASLNVTRRLTDGWMLRAFLNFGEGEWKVPASYLEYDDPSRAPAGGDRDGDLFMTASGGALGTLIGAPGRGTRYLQSGWSATVTTLVQIAPQRKWGFNLGGTISAREGTPLPLRDRGLVSDGRRLTVGVSRRADDFRLDDLYLLDLRIDKEIQVRKDLKLNVYIDGFNLLNDRSVLSRGSNLDDTSAFWAFDTISPRIYRLGAALRWN